MADLILHEPTRWNSNLIRQLFQPQSATQILSVYLPDREEYIEHKLIWKPHPKGQFSWKSFIKSLKDKQPSSSTSCSDNFPWKTFWKVRDLAPKILIFIWRVVHDGLAIFKKLGKHIAGINQECRSCKAAIEDLEHLFLHCPVATTTFFGSPLGCRTAHYTGLSINQVIAGWLMEKGNVEVFKMGSCVMWALWKNRNSKVFDNKDQSIQSIIKEAVYWFNYTVPLLPEEEQEVQPCISKQPATKWSRPETEWTKLNMDAAFDNFKGAWAVVARDHDIKFKGCGTMSHAVLNPIEAEIRAFLLATEFAVMTRLQRVIFESDAELVVRMLTDEKDHIPWRLFQLVFQIRAHLKNIAEYKIIFNKRDGNSVAHSLANYALNHQSNMWWFSSKPPS